MTDKLTEEERMIQVCDKCLRAACWQGELMCEEAQIAGAVHIAESELKKAAREHSDYWLTDDELGILTSRWGSKSR